ncbi:LacI family DNA-binding transcriptional regulator [Planctomonas sp. JC2975]|uniref:LacI family DNA-binding transcriptional regulator n=1 Tax=Planctomonas sp. JC2975 TaxID=2729626 RepID=UPI001473F15D|nr:LacI family DNA-binding transcriptional regulator [Planctomonas sp. JC2975]NNC12571.1 LacI family DNA-binding transcriptional regulator [Planctomonas sp. JC2975]
METNRRATIVDVASAVGVSRQTVSRAMNDMPGISARTKERVLEAARVLGYRPSRFGRGLVKRGQQTVGLMVNNLRNPYFPELAAAIVAHAARLDWSVLLLDTSGIDDQRELLSKLAPQVDALLGYVDLSKRELDLILPGVPVIRIDTTSHSGAANWGGVQFDLLPGLREAIAHLRSRGVSRPLVLDSGGADGRPSLRARVIVKEWAAQGIDAPVLETGRDDVHSGEATTALHLDQVQSADAIMAFNDYTAFGAMKALRRNGIHVPEDIRVMGIDGLAAGTYTTPELTTLGVDMEEAAEATMSITRSLLDPAHSPGPRWQRISHRLILRESA